MKILSQPTFRHLKSIHKNLLVLKLSFFFRRLFLFVGDLLLVCINIFSSPQFLCHRKVTDKRHQNERKKKLNEKRKRTWTDVSKVIYYTET